ncbi:e3 ubiquitin-protein ligase upl6 [Nannochloropsis gaditana]|uniref:HECT-type E3 ubiquitin transferase n=2 Tax=Nannochloropsis gaditana TaxID=72520 RepID=W7TQY7_9STRA|nr:e3 ubiquitin-protein ligase upl6 [Nannochloropsis gaditana]
MFFEGEAKRRPNVSLRGKSREEEKAELLVRARRERQARAADKEKRNAALAILRFHRSRKIVAAFKAEQVAEFDKRMMDLWNLRKLLQKAQRPLPTPTSLVEGLVGQLISFYSPIREGDNQRLLRLAYLLLDSCGSTNAAWNYKIWRQSHPALFEAEVVRFTRLCLYRIDALRRKRACEQEKDTEGIGATGAEEEEEVLLKLVEELLDLPVGAGDNPASEVAVSWRMLLQLTVEGGEEGDCWGHVEMPRTKRRKTCHGDQCRRTPLPRLLLNPFLARLQRHLGLSVLLRRELLAFSSSNREAKGSGSKAFPAALKLLWALACTAAGLPRGFPGVSPLPPPIPPSLRDLQRASRSQVARSLLSIPKLFTESSFSPLLAPLGQGKALGLWGLLDGWDRAQQPEQEQLRRSVGTPTGRGGEGQGTEDVGELAVVRNLLDLTRMLLQRGGEEGDPGERGGGMPALVRALGFSVRRVPFVGEKGGGDKDILAEDEARMAVDTEDLEGVEGGDGEGGTGSWRGKGLEEAIWNAMRVSQARTGALGSEALAMATAAREALKKLCEGRELPRLFDRFLEGMEKAGEAGREARERDVVNVCRLCSHVLVHAEDSLPTSVTHAGAHAVGGPRPEGLSSKVLNLLAYHQGRDDVPFVRRLWGQFLLPKVLAAGGGRKAFAAGNEEGLLPDYYPAFHLLFSVYSHQLMALDDEEFYLRQTPLSLSQVLVLVDALKGLLYQMYWVDPNRLLLASSSSLLPPLEALQLTRVATELFNQLYQRHSRRPFPPAIAAEAERGVGDRDAMEVDTSTTVRGYNRSRAGLTAQGESDPALWHWPAITQHELDQELSAAESVAEQPPQLPYPQSHAHVENSTGASSIETLFDTSKRLYPVLTRIPQVLPFAQRVQVFHKLLAADKRQAQDEAQLFGHRIRIRRAHIYEDAFKALNHLGHGLRGRVQVTFVSDLGTEEAGIDGGGVFKEFMDALTKRAFDPQYALFRVTPDHLLYPNPLSGLAVGPDHLQHFAFLGKVLAKALYESILVEPQFAIFFLQRLGGKLNETDDLFSRDPELYRHLMSLKRLAREGEGVGADVRDLSLNFEVVVEDDEKLLPQEAAAVELVPGGKHVPVTNQNVFRYIQLVANHKLNVEINTQAQAFLRGFRDLIPMPWLRMFGAEELQILLTGEKRAIDIENLRAHTRYSGGYHPSQPIIHWFWEALRSYTPDEQAAFLMFVTSCSRQPLLGFQHLNPPVCIQRVPLTTEGGERLPSSATCMNLLKLPAYPTPEMLREKLLYAITAGAGFELS